MSDEQQPLLETTIGEYLTGAQLATDCGFTHEDNRPKTNGQDEFRCLKCGYEIHADYNAAKNIAVKCTTNFHRSHTSSGGGAPVDVRLNSGLLTVEGRGTVVPR